VSDYGAGRRDGRRDRRVQEHPLRLVHQLQDFRRRRRSGTTNFKNNGTNYDVYATLIFADNAYGVCPLSGQAMQTYVKALGSAGTADPLEQRSTVGWKATTTTKILNEPA
jgi:N4-gp56 family major capsid protein